MAVITNVSVVRRDGREPRIRSVIELLGNKRPTFSNKSVVVKPNTDFADPFPASTHNNTIAAIIQSLLAGGAKA